MQGRGDLTRSRPEGFGGLAKDDEMVVEATGHAMAVVRALRRYVGRVIVVNPRRTSSTLSHWQFDVVSDHKKVSLF